MVSCLAVSTNWGTFENRTNFCKLYNGKKTTLIDPCNSFGENWSSCLVLKKRRRQNKTYKNKKNNQSIDLLVNYLCSPCVSKGWFRFFSITLTLEKLIIGTNVTGLSNVYLPWERHTLQTRRLKILRINHIHRMATKKQTYQCGILKGFQSSGLLLSGS